MPPSKTVVIGFLGTVLDHRGRGGRRKWRPTVDLCRHRDLAIDRLELLYDGERWADLAEQVLGDVRRASPETTARAHSVSVEDPWDFEQVYGALHDFVRAYPFKAGEDYLVHMTTGTHVAQICWFLLTESRRIPAKLLQTSPPTPRGSGGPGSYTVIDLDLSKYDRLAARFEAEQADGLTFLKAGIATRNAGFNAVIEQLEQVAAASPAPILLTGPTGAGKSRLARRIHALKRRRGLVGGELVEVNCATLRGDHAMATLFGHTKGAFTGAVKARPGLLRAADGGVLFLDEVGELGLDEQAMLLRAVEEKRFLPVGADVESESDFQLLAGTNRDLRAAVRDGGFREDLLARIDLWTFRLPALRERPEDLAPNLDYELEETGRKLGVRLTMTRDARKAFLDFATSPGAVWAGNFRDLNAAVTRMATLAVAGRIRLDDVRREIARLEEAWSASGSVGNAGHAELARVLTPEARTALDPFDAVQLREVLRVCANSATLSEAGRTLFAASRQRKRSSNDADRLRKYLAKFGLKFTDVQGA